MLHTRSAPPSPRYTESGYLISGEDSLQGTVMAVSRSEKHTFSKPTTDRVLLRAGWGVEGDAHAGVTIKHRSRVAQDPGAPNLRQVHLLHAELFDELLPAGFQVSAGQLGENITTRGLDLLGLPRGSRLHFADRAIVEITGLRNPCAQIDGLLPGLLSAVLGRDQQGALIRMAGVMAVVIEGGEVRPGTPVSVELPPPPHAPLERV